MGKKLFLALFIVAIAGLIVPAHAACATAFYSATTEYNGITITGTSYTPAGCDGVSTARILIKQGSTVLCEGPLSAFGQDPFGFSAGPHSTPSEECGANFSVSSVTDVFLPDPSAVAADPGTPSASVALRKNGTVSASNPNTYRYSGGSGTIPAGTPGYLLRGVLASG